MESFSHLNSCISEDIITAYYQIEQHIKQHVYSFLPLDLRSPRSKVIRNYSSVSFLVKRGAVDERKEVTRN